MGKILITGGSGLVGSALTELLLQHGYEVEHLSRSKNSRGHVRVRLWDTNKKWIEEGSFDNLDGIIHLAGAGIADVRHNEEGKELLTKSRVNSAQLLFEKLKESQSKIDFFISASAIGYYGMKTTDEIYSETSPAGNDFVADLCKKWETSADAFSSMARVAKVRIGLVLDKDQGALHAISLPTQFGMGASLGSGKQWMPWIHKKDLASLFNHIIQNKMEGTFNAVAPEHVNNRQFTKAVANAFKAPFLFPAIPGKVLKVILGEKANLVLEGSRVSSQKIVDSGFEFEFSTLKKALDHLYA
ncbi:MAG: TIGR01777 family oxidoreductase [Bacteroidota bacterium]